MMNDESLLTNYAKAVRYWIVLDMEHMKGSSQIDSHRHRSMAPAEESGYIAIVPSLVCIKKALSFIYFS